MLRDLHTSCGWDYTPHEVRTWFAAKSGRRDGVLIDIGAGCGAIAVDWVGGKPGRTALAIEPDARMVPDLVRNACRGVSIVARRFAEALLPATPYSAWIGCISFLSAGEISALALDPNLQMVGASHHRPVEPANLTLLISLLPGAICRETVACAGARCRFATYWER